MSSSLRTEPTGNNEGAQRTLDATTMRSDAGSIVARPLPSETMFMLMLVHLKSKVNKLEEALEE